MLNYSIVRPDKIEKVCKLLSETIINLFNNKESDLENLRKEIEKLDAKNDSPSLVEFDQNSIEIDKLMEKLFDPHMQNESKMNPESQSKFSLSPVLWAFIKVYFEILAMYITDVSAQIFKF